MFQGSAVKIIVQRKRKHFIGLKYPRLFCIPGILRYVVSIVLAPFNSFRVLINTIIYNTRGMMHF